MEAIYLSLSYLKSLQISISLTICFWIGIEGVQHFVMLVHLFLKLISVGSDWAREILPSDFAVWVLQGLVLSLLLFNICMRLLDKLICHHGMKYHQNPDYIQKYISVSSKLSKAMDILSWCLEAVRVWRGNNRFALIPDWL